MGIRFAAIETVTFVLETAKAWDLVSCHVEACWASERILPSLPPSVQHLNLLVALEELDLIKLQHLPDLCVLTLVFPRCWWSYRCKLSLSQSNECNLHTLHLQNGILDLGSPAEFVAFAAGMRKLR